MMFRFIAVALGRARWLLVSMLALGLLDVSAQDLDFVDSGQLLGNDQGKAVALGDLDGDGDLDAFIANGNDFTSNPNKIYINQGGSQGGVAGQFQTSGQLLGGSSNSQAVALGDLDGDGDLDAFVANGFNIAGTADVIYWNDGNGTFQAAVQDLGNQTSSDVALADIDGDGDLDAIVTEPTSGLPNPIWINQGGMQGGVEGAFVDGGTLGTSAARTVALGDLDGDGDVDAMIGGALTGLELWINQGGVQAGTSGTFVDSGQRLVLGGGFAEAVYLVDFDGDGHLDAYAANNGSNPEDEIWMNPGPDAAGDPGQFQAGWTGPARVSLGTAIADFDGDGDPDVYIAHAASSGGRANAVWLNDGSGMLSDTGLALGDSQSVAAAAGDMDGDGDIDVLVVNGAIQAQPDRLWLAEGSGGGGPVPPELEFVDAEEWDFLRRSHDVAFADLNQDGELDLVFVDGIAPSPDSRIMIWLKESSILGRFYRIGIGRSVGETKAVAVGDLDGDGAPDIYAANGFSATVGNAADRVRFQTPNGGFATGTQTLGNSESSDVALGDLDGDGDLDAIVTNTSVGVVNTIWINQGRAQGVVEGVFLDVGGLGTSPARTVALGDLDGDGDLDALIGGALTGLELWVNQGGAQAGTPGTFVDSGQRLVLGNGFAEAVYLADFDGDGHLDAYAANNGSNPEDVIWMNPGPDASGNPGVFQVGWTGPARASFDAAIADYDQDGDLDVFVAHASAAGGRANAVWLNDGSGMLADSGLAVGDSRTVAVAAGDVDGDGDPDVIAANGIDDPELNRLWLARFAITGPTNADLVMTPASNVKYNVDLDEITGSVPTGIATTVTNLGPETATNLVYTVSGRGDLQCEDLWASSLFRCDSQSCSADQMLPGQSEDFEACFTFLSPEDLDRPLFNLGFFRPQVSLVSDAMDPTPGGRSASVEYVYYRCANGCFIERIWCQGATFWPLPDTSDARSATSALGNFLPDLPIYYLLRQTMNYGDEGQRLVQRYAAHQAEIWDLMQQDPLLFADAIEVLSAWQPLLAALVSGDPDSEFVTQARVDLLDDFLAQLETLGSPALAQAIADERLLIGPFIDLVGLTAGQAADLLIPSEVIFKNGFERPELLTD